MATNKRVSIEFDFDSQDVKIVSDRVLSLTEQMRILKKELGNTQEGTKQFELLKNKLNETKDNFDRVNAKSRELFGTLSLIPGPIGEIAGKVNGAISLLKTFSGFSLKDLSSQFRALKEDVVDILVNLGTWGDSTKNAEQANKGLTKSTQEQSSAFSENVQKQLGLESANARVAEKIDETSKSNETLTKTTTTASQAITTEAVADGQLTVASEAATAGTRAQTTATNTLTVSARASAIALGILRAVLFSLGIGAIIAAVGFLIDKIGGWISSTKEADTANQKLTDTLAQLDRQLSVTQQAIQDETKLLITRAKIAGKTADEIAGIELNSWEKRIKANKEGRKLLEENAEAIIRDYRISEEQKTKLIEDNAAKIVKNSQELGDLLAGQRQAQADDELRKVEEKKKRDDKAAQDSKERGQKAKEQRNKELEELAQFQREADLTLMEAKAKEIAELNDKYQKQIDLAKKYKQDTTDIEAARNKEIAEVNKKYDKEALDAKAKEYDARIQLALDSEKVDLENLKKLLDERAKIAMSAEGLSNEERLAIQAEYNKKYNDAVKKQKENELLIRLDAAKGDRDAQIQIYQQLLDELKTMDQMNLEERFNLQNEYQSKILGLIDAKQQERLLKTEEGDTALLKYDSDYYANLRVAYDQYQADLDSAKEKGQITDDEYTKRTRANSKAKIDLDKQERDSKLELAGVVGNALGAVADLVGRNTVAGKALAVAQATIDTYAAAAKALAAYPPPFSYIAAGTAVAAGILNVKKILSVKVPGKEGSDSTTAPTAPTTTGRVISVSARAAQGGLIQGPGSSYSDSIPAMLSNGEFVVNSRSTSMFKPLLSAINNMGNLPRYAQGGMLNAVPAKSSDDTQRITDAISQGFGSYPIKTYVTASDVSSQQQFERITKSRSLI